MTPRVLAESSVLQSSQSDRASRMTVANRDGQPLKRRTNCLPKAGQNQPVSAKFVKFRA